MESGRFRCTAIWRPEMEIELRGRYFCVSLASELSTSRSAVSKGYNFFMYETVINWLVEKLEVLRPLFDTEVYELVLDAVVVEDIQIVLQSILKEHYGGNNYLFRFFQENFKNDKGNMHRHIIRDSICMDPNEDLIEKAVRTNVGYLFNRFNYVESWDEIRIIKGVRSRDLKHDLLVENQTGHELTTTDLICQVEEEWFHQKFNQFYSVRNWQCGADRYHRNDCYYN